MNKVARLPEYGVIEDETSSVGRGGPHRLILAYIPVGKRICLIGQSAVPLGVN